MDQTREKIDMAHLPSIASILKAAFLAIALVSSPAFARDTATAAKYFSSHMVLQRDQPIVVWGDAVPGSVVPIVFDGESREARTNSKGQWRTVFSPRKASFEPVVLQVGDKTFEDILIGDVFLASGQSNMHWPVQKSDVKKYPHTKYNDRIRLLKMHYLRARAPEGYTDKELARSNSDDFFQGSWERADLKEISDFSAVAWTAGSLIANDQDVPIGLVQVAVGGSALNNWIPQRVLRTHPFTRHIFKGDFFTNPYFLKPHKERGKQALQRAMSPNEPFIIGKSKYRWMCEPSFLFDAGIAPLKHAGLKAVLWYQGESDATRVEHTVHYRELFPRMVESWRENFRDPNLPFFVIQLPGYDSPYWPALREAQSMAVDQMSNASLIVTYDLGEKKNIHPSDKREVGERLAAAVLANVYGVGGLPVYPGIFEISGEGSELEIRLSNFKSGKPGKSIEGFEIGNEYGRYAPAEAKFTSSDTLLVSSKIDGPKFVRFGAIPFPSSQLAIVNDEGLPLPPSHFQKRDGRWMAQ